MDKETHFRCIVVFKLRLDYLRPVDVHSDSQPALSTQYLCHISLGWNHTPYAASCVFPSDRCEPPKQAICPE